MCTSKAARVCNTVHHRRIGKQAHARRSLAGPRIAHGGKFVYDEVSAEKLRSDWQEGFEANNPSEVLAPLDDRVREYLFRFPNIREGTRAILTGRVLDTIAGPDFGRALPGRCPGDEPHSARLEVAVPGLAR